MDDDQIIFEEDVEDCADYFATVLTETYPEVDLIRFEANDWRVGWKIIVPSQFTESVADLEAAARGLRDMLFWNRGVLLPYIIERPKD